MTPDDSDNVQAPSDQTDDELTLEQLDAVTGGGDEGFNVITWDPRGEGASGGTVGRPGGG